MKPLLLEAEDDVALQNLGQASVQIVHDLKNQLNGLKLYATFLRKRLEKGEHATDELETVNKLISGLDRMANDLTCLIRYGRPIELKKKQHIDLQELLSRVCSDLEANIDVESASEPFLGEFDPELLVEGFRAISLGALKMQGKKDDLWLQIRLRTENVNSKLQAIIEWHGVGSCDYDPFKSFAGSEAIRMSLASRIIEAHKGCAEHDQGLLRVRLPL